MRERRRRIRRLLLLAGGAAAVGLPLAQREDAAWALVAVAAWAGLAAATLHPRVVRRDVGRATPGTLGAIRALTCATLLVNALWEDLPSSALIPRGMLHPTGVMVVLQALPGFALLLTCSPALRAVQTLTALALLCGALGLRTRVALPVGAAGYLVQAGILRSYAWFYHTGLVPLYVLVVLCLAPCADGLSLDRWLAVRRGQAVPEASRRRLVYGWARYACWLVIALPYTAAGLSKLRRSGLAWFYADNMKSILLIDSLNPMQFDWGVSLRLVHAPDAFFTLLATAAVVGEVTFVLVLVSRQARRVLPVVTALMHLGVWLLQNVLFFDLVLLQTVFYDWSHLGGCGRRALARWLPGRRPAALRNPAGAEVWPRRVRALAGVLLFCWAVQLEQYPFTAMQMYTYRTPPGVIDYYRVVAVDAAGRTFRAPLEDAVPALRDSRYRRVVRHAFDKPAGRSVAQQLLEVCGRRLNERGAKIVRFEVQKRRWEYEAAPDDAAHGVVVESFVHEMAR